MRQGIVWMYLRRNPQRFAKKDQRLEGQEGDWLEARLGDKLEHTPVEAQTQNKHLVCELKDIREARAPGM